MLGVCETTGEEDTQQQQQQLAQWEDTRVLRNHHIKDNTANCRKTFSKGRKINERAALGQTFEGP